MNGNSNDPTKIVVKQNLPIKLFSTEANILSLI